MKRHITFTKILNVLFLRIFASMFILLQRVVKMNKSEDQEIDNEELSEDEIQMLSTGLLLR